MKRILCFGDSNTWGFDPATRDRLDEHSRWTRVLARELGKEYEIIEEGLNGRTTVWDDPMEAYRNGREYLIPCLETHRYLDAVIIFLGTNDLKKRMDLSAQKIADGAGELIGIVKESGAGIGGRSPLVLLIAPPPLSSLTDFAEMFEGAEIKSRKFAEEYDRVASVYACAFLDTSKIIVSSPLDGIHLESGEHAKLGAAIAKKIKEMFG
jgi:lysophospholipase L1-like esterase